MVETRKKAKSTRGAKKASASKKGSATSSKKSTSRAKKPTTLKPGTGTLPSIPPIAHFHPDVNGDLIAQANSMLDSRPKHMFSGARACGDKHVSRCTKFEMELIEVILSEKASMSELCLLQTNIHGKTFHNIPLFFTIVSGIVDLGKAQLVSKILFRWISEKEPQRDGTGRYLQPVTTMNYLRTLLGHMKSTYDWRYEMEKSFNFPGGLKGMLVHMFHHRRIVAGESYGTDQNRAVMAGVSTVKDLDLSIFNLDDIVEHQKCLMVVWGAFGGFRGNKEHTYLERHHIISGVFPSNHPRSGQSFWTIQNMEDKTNKLTTTNTTLTRKEANQPKIPVDSIPGQIISKYLEKLSPGQTRIYCKPATIAQKFKFLGQGHPNAVMSPNQPIGINTIRSMLNDACKQMGHPECTGHGFCRLFITTLANDSGVSVEESLGSARHSSVAAQRTYMQRDGVSKCAKFAALGI